MPPTPATNVLGRVLDIVCGKKLEGDDAERARAEWAPPWVCTVYLVLLWASLLASFALLAWSWGWIPFLESRIDSIWALAALGVNTLLRFAWEWITTRHERRAKTGPSSTATFSE